MAGVPAQAAGAGGASSPPDDHDDSGFAAQRAALVAHLRATGVDDEAVLAALGRVARHRMVPAELVAHAYEDRPLPIGDDQTISQPTVVGLMTQLAGVGPGDRVLEVGTGSGYQAAVLAELGVEVFSVEVVEPLAERAHAMLAALGYGERIHTRVGDGYAGWPEEAPFDAVVVTAAAPEVPTPLLEQLAVGGRLVAPIGGPAAQELLVVTRTPEGPAVQRHIPVRFVPMTGRAQQRGR